MTPLAIFALVITIELLAGVVLLGIACAPRRLH